MKIGKVLNRWVVVKIIICKTEKCLVQRSATELLAIIIGLAFPRGQALNLKGKVSANT